MNIGDRQEATVRIDVIFDVAEASPYFAPTVDAVHHAVDALGVSADICVVRTRTMDDTYFDDLPSAFVIGPGSPYDAPTAAEIAIAVARDEDIPLVGT